MSLSWLKGIERSGGSYSFSPTQILEFKKLKKVYNLLWNWPPNSRGLRWKVGGWYRFGILVENLHRNVWSSCDFSMNMRSLDLMVSGTITVAASNSFLVNWFLDLSCFVSHVACLVWLLDDIKNGLINYLHSERIIARARYGTVWKWRSSH